MENLENDICFPFGMIHKIRFSLIECDDSQIICYLFPSLSSLKSDVSENSGKKIPKQKKANSRNYLRQMYFR